MWNPSTHVPLVVKEENVVGASADNDEHDQRVPGLVVGDLEYLPVNNHWARETREYKQLSENGNEKASELHHIEGKNAAVEYVETRQVLVTVSLQDAFMKSLRVYSDFDSPSSIR